MVYTAQYATTRKTCKAAPAATAAAAVRKRTNNLFRSLGHSAKYQMCIPKNIHNNKWIICRWKYILIYTNNPWMHRQTHTNKEISFGVIDGRAHLLWRVLAMSDVNANGVDIKGDKERFLFFESHLWDDDDGQVGAEKRDKRSSHVYNLLAARTRKQKTSNVSDNNKLCSFRKKSIAFCVGKMP